jgi:hypothetical protein
LPGDHPDFPFVDGPLGKVAAVCIFEVLQFASETMSTQGKGIAVGASGE